MEKTETKPIVFTVIEIDGTPKVFVNEPWPQFTSVDYDAVAAANTGLVHIDGDSLKFTAANGTAEYLKTETEGENPLYELVDSTFEPMPGVEQEEPEAEATALAPPEEPVQEDGEEPLVIDTHAEDAPLASEVFEPRKTFGQVVAAEVRAAHLRNDAAGHAALHNFDIALGDFKRAAQQVLPSLPKESELAQIIESIVADL
jgi:hypothetical protein